MVAIRHRPVRSHTTDGPLQVTASTGEMMLPPPTPLVDRVEASAPVLARPPSKTGEKVRQSFSCAECRRLKLKCSREWPCTSCEKRGCALICPNGEMKTGKGKRLILADTEELHSRIAQLEAALAQSHAAQSTDPHPLLEDTYVFTHPGPVPAIGLSSAGLSNNSLGLAARGGKRAEAEEVVDSAFGSLTIGTEGEAKYLGSFAGSEYLREEGEGEGSGSNSASAEGSVAGERPRGTGTGPGTGIGIGLATPPPSAIPQEGGFNTSSEESDFVRSRHRPGPYAEGGLALADSFVSGGIGAIYDIDALRAELPDWGLEGQALCQSYWENVNWMYQILPRAMFDQDHLLNAYDTESPPNAHKLACVFLLMAVGTMFDLTRPPFDPRGQKLFLLGRACLSAVGLEHANPATVQALHLCGTYMMNDKHGNGAEMFWPILGTAVKVAQSLGLHRDGAAFGLSEYEVAERRQVWWELVTYDRLQALCFGRPCATSNKSADTKPPEGTPEAIADLDGYHHAKYRLMSMMERVIDVQTQTSPVPYAVIAQLDTELREVKDSLPETLMPHVPIQELPLGPSNHPHLVIHRLGIRLLVAQTRLLLNRPSFARAIKDNPEDPSRSKVGVSFMGLYESAQEIVQLVKQLVIYHPSLIARWWFFWFHAFSSAVCLSAIAIRAPFSAFASPAFAGLSIVCDISAAAREGCRAKKGLPILVRLRKRALSSLIAASQAAKSNPKRKDVKVRTDTEKKDDDLSHLVGTSKLRRVGSSGSGNKSESPKDKRISLSAAGEALMTPAQAQAQVQSHFRGAAGYDPSLQPQLGFADYSPSDTASTSTTLADNSFYEGVVPSFPADSAVLPQNLLPQQSQGGISPQGVWVGAGAEWSPPWSDTSLGYTSTGASAGGGSSVLEYPGFHNNNNFSVSPSTMGTETNNHNIPGLEFPFEPAYNANDGLQSGMLGMDMDMDMSMALGLEDHGQGGGGGGADEWMGFDFEAFVQGMGGGDGGY